MNMDPFSTAMPVTLLEVLAGLTAGADRSAFSCHAFRNDVCPCTMPMTFQDAITGMQLYSTWKYGAYSQGGRYIVVSGRCRRQQPRKEANKVLTDLSISVPLPLLSYPAVEANRQTCFA